MTNELTHTGRCECGGRLETVNDWACESCAVAFAEAEWAERGARAERAQVVVDLDSTEFEVRS